MGRDPASILEDKANLADSIYIKNREKQSNTVVQPAESLRTILDNCEANYFKSIVPSQHDSSDYQSYIVQTPNEETLIVSQYIPEEDAGCKIDLQTASIIKQNNFIKSYSVQQHYFKKAGGESQDEDYD